MATHRPEQSHVFTVLLFCLQFEGNGPTGSAEELQIYIALLGKPRLCGVSYWDQSDFCLLPCQPSSHPILIIIKILFTSPFIYTLTSVHASHTFSACAVPLLYQAISMKQASVKPSMTLLAQSIDLVSI